ncbi:hypothetical protein B0O99DRAFT_574074 [Bisporella sp. PMI_857]|nr:hypothetical protein B0O99DRAFT_574074 [Bisporella sp. PMI_857]
MGTIEISGNVRNRFIQVVALLHMLDPVRGEPTVYGLDQDPFEIEGPRERLLKRKFLDSFALVCARYKDGDTVSAACIEEGRPEGTILRIASNAGVSADTLSQLRKLVDLLNNVASGGAVSVDVYTIESAILSNIIQLDITKIRGYVECLRQEKGVFEEPISAVESRILASPLYVTRIRPYEFLNWFEYISFIRSSPTNDAPDVLFKHVKWAQKAKKDYLDFLKLAFSTKDQRLPTWVYTVFKLGRYGIASRALVQLASEAPALFNPMTVEAVQAPAKFRVTTKDEAPLTCVLRRVVESRVEEFKPRLARIWDTTDADAEAVFRKSCTFDLVAHAELQLVHFYDHNPHLKPAFRFIGISKKSCYLCHMFLASHPESFSVSSCHQKLYRSWIPPPVLDHKIHKRYKTIINELSKAMEAIARQDLDTRLGVKRRPVAADSTAGVSLGGLTELGRSSITTQAIVEQIQPASIDEVSTIVGCLETQKIETNSGSLISPIEVASITQADSDENGLTEFGCGILPSAEHQFFDLGSRKTILTMVFHFQRLSDSSRQDIISVGDIFDYSTNSPSWTRLVKLLSVKDNLGLAFKEGNEFLLVNDLIRVADQRQFLACFQYLMNLAILNVEVLICSTDEIACLSSRNPS